MMPKCLGGLSATFTFFLLPFAVLPLATQAQTVEELTSASQDAVDLLVKPRITADYNSSGGGYDGYGGIEGFIPLRHVPGENLTFFIGRFNLDNDANPGGSLIFGYREDTGKTIWGGHAGIDVTSTGDSTFPQLSLGVEALKKKTDFRANLYIPLGDTRQKVFESVVPFGDLGFKDNRLVIESNITQQFEVALMGLDFEIGQTLLEFGEEGKLRGYAGAYYYDGKGIGGTLGARARLEARANDDLFMSAGVQHDDLFGTNLLFRVGYSFQKRNAFDKAEPELLHARIDEPVVRRPVVGVGTDTETGVGEVAAINPKTGQPYIFRHVFPGSGGDDTAPDATIENPRATIEAATQIANRYDIIYVRSDDGRINAGGSFTIPDGVEVRSVGPLQQIQTTNFGLVTLPESNQGLPLNPTVDGTATLGNDILLSGVNFDAGGGTNDGIVANGVGNLNVEYNTVHNADDGFDFQNVTGNVSLTNNTVEMITGDGAQITDAAIDNLTVTGNTFEAGTDPFPLTPAVQAQLAAVIAAAAPFPPDPADLQAIVDNNPGGQDEGIFFEGFATRANISNNTITAGNDAIQFQVIDGTIEDLVISGNTLTGGNDAIEIEVPLGQGGQLTAATISGNTMTSGDDGIDIYERAGTDLCVAITGNTSTNTSALGAVFPFTLIPGFPGLPPGNLSSDVEIGNTGGGTVRIVDLANLAINNGNTMFPTAPSLILEGVGSVAPISGTAGVAGCPN